MTRLREGFGGQAGHARGPMGIRRRELARIHMGKKALGMDEATYRALLVRLTGKESAGDLDWQGRAKVLDYMRAQGFGAAAKRAGARPVPRGGAQAKATALWLSLWHLGEIADPSEAHLAAFIARELEKNGRPPVAARQWLDQDGLNIAIKALRGWCNRIGFVQPDAAFMKMVDEARRVAELRPAGPGFAAKARLIEAQWKKLETLGAFRHGMFARLDTWLWKQVEHVSAPWFLAPAKADEAIDKLGRWIRRAKREAKGDGNVSG